ncbi:MAG: phospholipid carrier-dependent glycosyltransferase, partial [Moorea sp. SIO2B7]|nr:phospholipid carrier-dependent glycosyltransferase [Moorena sp. SIO2B7]
MITKKKQQNSVKSLFILVSIWVVGALCDRLWFWLDHSFLDWDQADYLNGVMNYWRALQTPQWFNGEWWRSFWLLSSKIPPLTYIATTPLFNFLGISHDSATLFLLLCSAILLISVYGLGVKLFNPSVGLWAAVLCQLLPGLYHYRLDFLLDYPLTAFVTLNFYLLTLWKLTEDNYMRTVNPPYSLLRSWSWAALFGISLGLALLLKQTTVMFLFLPIFWLLVDNIKRQRWQKISQLMAALCLSIFVCGFWYRTNWLLILTSGKRATVDSAIAEGEPALHTIEAWTYYGKILPYILSWHLLLVPIVGFLIYLIKKPQLLKKINLNSNWRWIAIFLLGGYLLSSLNMNKDARYILPLLPVLSLVLAAGLLSWTGRWKSYIRWGTIGLALLLMLLNIFPLPGGGVTKILSPRTQHYPYMGQKWQHEKVVQEIINTSPYLTSTLGVLPSTSEINQHNFSFYGGKSNYQVYGRQVGVREHEVEQDGRSLNWFITKTGEQGSIPSSQKAIVNLVEQGGDFKLQNSWHLPDDSTLKLYHRKQASVEVKPISESIDKVRLDSVTLPEKTPP